MICVFVRSRSSLIVVVVVVVVACIRQGDAFNFTVVSFLRWEVEWMAARR